MPLKVGDVLSRPAEPDIVEQTSILLSTYEEDEFEKDKRTAARKAAEQLSESECRAYIFRFIEQNGRDYTSSFDFVTGKFLNPAENVEFKRWLEKQLIQNNAFPALVDASHILLRHAPPNIF